MSVLRIFMIVTSLLNVRTRSAASTAPAGPATRATVATAQVNYHGPPSENYLSLRMYSNEKIFDMIL